MYMTSFDHSASGPYIKAAPHLARCADDLEATPHLARCADNLVSQAPGVQGLQREQCLCTWSLTEVQCLFCLGFSENQGSNIDPETTGLLLHRHAQNGPQVTETAVWVLWTGDSTGGLRAGGSFCLRASIIALFCFEHLFRWSCSKIVDL